MSESEDDAPVLSLVKSVSGGAIKYLTTTSFSRGAGFLFTILLTQSFGAGVYGLYAFGTSVISILRNFADLGADMAIVRFVTEFEDDPNQQGVMVLLSYVNGVGGGIILATVLILTGPAINRLTVDNPQFPAILSVLAIILVLNNIQEILYAHFRATDLLNVKLLLNDILFPLLKLLLTAAVVYLGYSILGVIGVIVVAMVVVLVTGFYLLVQLADITLVIPSSTSTIRKFYNYSLPLTTGNIGSIMFQQSDILILGLVLNSSAVGIYKVAFLVGGIMALPVSGVAQLFPPIASRLYSSGEKERLNNLFSIVTRWLFALSLFSGTFIYAYRVEILSLFGEEFGEGALILLFIIGMQVTSNATGPSGSLLMMTDHQYIRAANQWIFGICNIVLTYVLVMEYGIVGAAIGTFVVNGALSATRMFELWKLEGFFPYSKAFAKPVVAAIVTGVAIHRVSTTTSGLVGLFFGGVVGVVVFGGAQYILGLEEEETDLLRSVNKWFYQR
jgi:O-antigen/teichoic acid export membrane protein